jgi:hypothetical protein
MLLSSRLTTSSRSGSDASGLGSSEIDTDWRLASERLVSVRVPLLASKLIVAVVLAVPLDCWFSGTTLLTFSSGTVIEALPPAGGSSVTMVVLVELLTVKVTLPVVGSTSGLKAILPVIPVGVDEAEDVTVVLDAGCNDDELGRDEDPLLAGEPLLLLLPKAEVELLGEPEDEALTEGLLGVALLKPEKLADAGLDGDEDGLDDGAEEDELGDELAD